jgi:hypothetical protein
MSYPIDYMYTFKNRCKDLKDKDISILYIKLIEHNNKYRELQNNNVVRFTGINTCVPAYLKKKYTNVIIPKHGKKSQLILIKNIFDKVSLSNVNEIIEEFKQLHIVDNDIEMDDEIYIYIYETMIDLIYLIDANIKILKYISISLPKMFNKIIEKSLYHSNINCHQVFTDEKKMKRWMINNSILISELFNVEMINNESLLSIYNNWINSNEIRYIDLLCTSLNKLKKQIDLSEIEIKLEKISIDLNYDFRIRSEISRTLELEIFY